MNPIVPPQGGAAAAQPMQLFPQQKDQLLSMILRQDSTSGDQDTNLHVAALHGDVEAMGSQLQLLEMIEQPDIIDHQNARGQTPLHIAVLENNPDMVDVLLRSGANPAIRDEKGNNVFHLAVKNPYTQIISQITNTQGANKTAGTIDAHNYDGYTPLHTAVQKKTLNAELLRALLDAGANINARDGKAGHTALYHAAETNDLDSCRLLLENGADVNVENYSGNTPVSAASGRKYTQVVALLTRYGAQTVMPWSSNVLS